MSVLYWREPDRERKEVDMAFWVGLALYMLSFLLPSITGAGGTASGMFRGWDCARFAFYGLFLKEVSGLAVFGGLINPLALAYIVLRIRDRAPGARWFLAGTILSFIPVQWLSLYQMHLRIYIGHIAWIAGLLLMIDWDDFRSQKKVES